MAKKISGDVYSVFVLESGGRDDGEVIRVSVDKYDMAREVKKITSKWPECAYSEEKKWVTWCHDGKWVRLSVHQIHAMEG